MRHSEEGAETVKDSRLVDIEAVVIVDFGAGKEVCVPRSWSDAEAAEFAGIGYYSISERRPCEAIEDYDHVTVEDNSY